MKRIALLSFLIVSLLGFSKKSLAQCTGTPITSFTVTDIVDVSCNGGSDGEIEVTLAGGQSPFTYALVIETGVGDIPIASFSNTTNQTVRFTGLSENASLGFYKVTVVTSNGGTAVCRFRQVSGIDVAEPTAISATVNTITPACTPGTGAITLDVSGGTPGYTYTWTGPTAIANTVEDPTNLNAGTYAVTIEDANGCTEVISNIVVPGQPTITLGTIPSVCTGTTSSTLGYSGVTGSPDQFRIDWTSGITDVALTTLPSTPIPINGIPVTPGTYTGTLFVRNSATGCESAGSPISVTVNPNVTPTVSIGATPGTSVCVGTSVTFTATPTNGGAAPIYQWKKNGGNVGTNGAIYTDAALVNGDQITVEMTSNAVCPVPATVTSNTITMTVNTVTAPFTQVNVSCFGGNDGSITVTPAGGTAPYDFSIDNGATFPILNVASHTFTTLTAGTYNIVVRDVNNCTAPATVTITQPAVALTAPFTQVNVSCFGGNNGSITVTPAGGTAPYDFSIDGGVTFPILDAASHTFTNLTAATYNIVVRDANNCTAPASVTIIQPAAALTAPFTQVNVSCFGGNNGSITVTPAGGTGPYDFSIDGGTTFPILNVASHTFTSLTAATYNIVVRDANNCTAPASVTITQPAAFTAPFTQVNVSCFGGNDGSITVTPAGGIAPYDFSIDGGATFPILNVASHTFTSLTAATYSIVVRDANNCTAPASVTITQPAVALTAPFTQVNVSCFGGNDGSITVTPAGGTGPYDFSIDNGATFPILNAASHTFTTLTAGAYNIVVRDANNCTAPATVTITQPAVALTAPFTQVNVSCFGGNDGSITVTPAGGTGPYDFSIDNGATFPILNAASHTFTTLTAGTYNIVVRDANNCTAPASVTITQPAIALTAPFTQVNVSCFGGNDGSITVTPAGGTGPYDFSIDGGATFPILNAASHTFTTLAAGTYNIVVRDANNCTAPASVTITQPAVALTAPFTQVNVSCFGGNDGSITVTPAGGTGPYDFSIDGGATFPILNVASHTFTSLTAATYNIVVRDANNCTAPASVTITQPAVTVTAPFTQVNVSCFGGNDGSITVTPAGGTGPYDFSIDGGATFPIVDVASHTFTSLTAATYNIVVRDASNCTAPATVTITQPAVALSAPFTQVNVSCFGGNDGSITVTPAGGTGPYDFSIDGGATFPIVDVASHTFTSLTAATYNIVVRDANNCTAPATVTITQPASFTAPFTQVNVSCFGGNDGSITVTPAGGAGPYDFSIDGGATFPVVDVASHTFTSLTAATYSIVVRDANNCTAPASVTITEPAVALTAPFTQVNVSCFGGNDGSITVTPAGGTAPYDFSIDGGATFPIVDVASHTFTTLTAATYNIVVRDANNCTAPASVTITQPAVALTAPFTQVNVSCFGGNNGSITVTPAGGTGPYDFSIDGGATFPVLDAASQTFSSLTATTYNIVVRDANNCTAPATVTITQPSAAVVVTSTSKTDATCVGVNNGSIQINSVTGGTPGYQYSIDNGATFQVSNTFTNLAAATYDVVARDVNNCVSVSVQVIVGTGLSFAPSASFTDASCSGVNDGTIQVNSVSGGTSPYNYSIDNGTTFQVSNSFAGLAPGTYDVVARDVNGCLSTAQVITIGSGLSFDPQATANPASCSGVSDGSIQVTGTTGGTTPFEYSNDGGTTFQISDTFTGLATGNYDIVVRDANTCISTTLVVNVGVGLSFDPQATSNPASCSGVNDGSIQVSGTTGGTSPFEYSNDGGTTFQTSDTFTGLATGNYDIVVRDANTCISTTLVVNVGVGLTFDPQATANPASCSGVNDGSIQVTGTTGGTTPFEYSNDGGTTFQISDTFTGLASGNYDIVVRDANTCISTTLVVNVGVGLTFDPQATGNPASCSGVNDGSIQVTGTTGGTAPFEYSNDGGTTFQTSDTFTGLSAGSYDIVVRDANTCISTTLAVAVGNGLTITATVNKTDATCLGNDGSITVSSVSGGTGPYEYSINNGATFQVSNVFNPVTVGNYDVVVRDANTCLSAVTPITINLPGGCGGLNCFAFTILPPTIQRPSCNDQNDGVVTLDITGQVAGNYIISLMIGGVAIGPPQIGPSGVYQFTSLSPADYQYRVQDQAGNVCVQDFTLLVETTVTASASGMIDATCFGQPTGQATITVSGGGSSPYDYSIDGNTWVLNKTSPILITDLPPNGTYSILVRDDASDQCPAEVSVTIGNGSPQIDIGLGTTSATCGNADGSITITTPASGGAGGPYLYQLDGNSVTPVANAFPNISGGSHTLTVIDDASDCQRDFVVVVPFPGIVATSSISTSSGNCTAGGTISFFINTPGATTYEIGFTTDFFNEATNYSAAYYTPPLSPGDDGFVQISDLPRGDYYIWVKPSSGACTTRVNSIPESVGGPYAVTFEIGCRETNGDLTLLNVSGEPGVDITYEIFGSSTVTGPVNLDPLSNAVITGFATEAYQIRLIQDQSASSGCIITTEFVAAPTGALDILSVETNESFPEQPTGSMLIKITESGSEPYEIWLVENTIGYLSDTLLAVRNPVTFEAKFAPLSGGSYTVYLEDARGCVKETTVELPLDGDVFVPNIFTPNNDNINEVFYIRNLPASGSKLVITNRWGKEVYSSNNYNPENLWNGGSEPDGVYYYRLQISGGGTYTGWVEILRGNKP